MSTREAATSLTGDVTNTGITDANGLVLTVGPPASPTGAYSNYAVGSLTADDFSSFTLTFTTNDLSNVPIIIQWKDANGNTLSATTNVDLKSLYTSSGTRSSSSGGSSTAGGSAAGSSAATTGGGAQYRGGGGGLGGIFGGGSRGGGLSAFYPVIAGAIILVIAIVLWMKRKWILAKLKKQ